MSKIEGQPAQQEPATPETIEALSLLTGFDGGSEEPAEEPEEEEDEGVEQPEAEEEELPEGDDQVVASEEDEEEPEVDDDPVEEWETNSGKKFRVKRSELRNGYMRQDDYQRKTATTAEQRRLGEQLVQAVQQEREQNANQIAVLGQALYTQLVGDERNLAGLIETDPHEYLRQSRLMDEKRQLLQQTFQHQEILKTQAAEQTAAQRRAYVEDQKEQLLQRRPEWRDTKKAKEGSQLVAKYLFDRGFTQDELNSLQDHRLILVALDAAQHTAAQSVKQKKVAAPIKKVLKPGAATPAGARVDKNLQRAREALRADPRDLEALHKVTFGG